MKNPSIAILRWESGHVPAGLLQLEQMPGNSTRSEERRVGKECAA